MASISLNDQSAHRALITFPAVGLWWAELELSDEIELSGSVTIDLLGRTLSGSIVSGAVVDGRSRYRVVAGAGGWGTELAPRAYTNDVGLTPTRIISDAASEAGEPTPQGFSVDTLGPHYNRPRGVATQALNTFAVRAWYAADDGAVNAGARAAQTSALPYPVVRRDPAARVVEVALEDSSVGVSPGALTEYGTASDVEVELSDGALRARLYAPFGSEGSRSVSAMARLVDAHLGRLRYAGSFEYRVVSQAGERLNLQPVRSRSNLPDLASVHIRAGVPGVKATHTPGSKVIVSFLDNDPTRPVVTGFDDPSSPAWHPLILQIGDSPALGVARQTDPVVAGGFGGTITLGSVRIKAGS